MGMISSVHLPVMFSWESSRDPPTPMPRFPQEIANPKITGLTHHDPLIIPYVRHCLLGGNLLLGRSFDSQICPGKNGKCQTLPATFQKKQWFINGDKPLTKWSFKTKIVGLPGYSYAICNPTFYESRVVC